jgi:hypothetical protein|tara:strand:+ start:666 stop:1271 length:606 start_codon:yes stop_codon:yes gene_type:complete
MTNELQIIEQPAVIKEVNTALKAITKKHKKVSNIPTPKAFIKKKMGMDYVEYSTMRDVADKEYPGWSWTIISSESLGSEAYVVHGRLKWYDCGVWREGDMVAAHRIQKKKGTTEFVDVGNDIKSANTDCIKKALNQYMNICDDVYKNQVDDPELNDDQIETLRQLAIKAQITDKVMGQIKNGEVNNLNFKASKAKLERMTA